jgi:DNA-nicking Smr family endonuclease
MSRRRATDEECALFKEAFAQARPLKLDAVPKARIVRSKSVAGPGGLDGRTSERLRRGTIEPDARLDLHGATQAAAHGALLSFLRNAQRGGAKLVLVVTGKGARPQEPDAPFDMERARGVLKDMVPRWLKEPAFVPLIAGVRAAHRRHGGTGAIYVYLRKLVERE